VIPDGAVGVGGSEPHLGSQIDIVHGVIILVDDLQEYEEENEVLA
tara:strand:+ start:159 stop:293 length:135 start_codon:yes stop_codon:yes gene_type:complete